jgi:hypothetical protein
MTVKEKSGAMCYVLAQLLIENADVFLLEKSDTNDLDTRRFNDKIVKLRSATRNAFNQLERNVGKDMEQLKNDIELTLDNIWN